MKVKIGTLVVLALFLMTGMTVFSPAARAEEAKFELKASTSLRDILTERTGKRTTLRMQSGEDIEGTIVLVGNSLVHVSRLAGKDFYDAVIEIDRINAVIMKVRDR